MTWIGAFEAIVQTLAAIVFGFVVGYLLLTSKL
jgi:hypothetical protein